MNGYTPDAMQNQTSSLLFARRLAALLFCLSVASASCSDPPNDTPDLPQGDGVDATDADAGDVDPTDSDAADTDQTEPDQVDTDESDIPPPDALDTSNDCGIDLLVETSSDVALAGARVEFDGPIRASAVTDESGRLTLDLDCGVYRVFIEQYYGVGQGMPDLVGWSLAEDLEVADRGEAELQVLVANLYGTVEDTAEQLVQGTARVEATLVDGDMSAFNRSTASAEDGTYSMVLPIHPVQSYTVSASVVSIDHTYRPRSEEIVLIADSAFNFVLTEVQPCLWTGNLRTSAGAVLGRGSFVLAELDDPDIVFFDSGDFEASLPCDTYTPVVSQPQKGDSLRPFLDDWTLPTTVSLFTDSDSGLSVLVFELSGQITTAESGIEGARVTAFGLFDGARVEGTAITTSGGDYALKLPPSDSAYSVTVSVPTGQGLIPPDPVDVTVGSDVEHDVEVSTTDVCTLTGGLVDTLANPIVGLGLQFEGDTDSGFVETDSDGEYELDLNCGFYSLRVFGEPTTSRPGFDGFLLAAEIDLSEDDSVGTILPIVEVSGVIEDGAENKVVGAEVTATAETEAGVITGVGVSDSDGEYLLAVIAGDTFQYSFDVVPASDSGYAVQRGSVATIAEDTTRDVLLVPLSVCALSGSIETSEGESVPEAQLVFSGERTDDNEQVTFNLTADADGAFEAAVNCGEFAVGLAFVRGPGAGPDYPLESNIPSANNWPLGRQVDLEGEVVETIVIPVARVSGTAMTVRGEPVAGAEIELVAEGTGGATAWNRVRSDSEGGFQLVVISSAASDYQVSIVPPSESELVPQSISERIVEDLEIDFVW